MSDSFINPAATGIFYTKSSLNKRAVPLHVEILPHLIYDIGGTIGEQAMRDCCTDV